MNSRRALVILASLALLGPACSEETSTNTPPAATGSANTLQETIDEGLAGGRTTSPPSTSLPGVPAPTPGDFDPAHDARMFLPPAGFADDAATTLIVLVPGGAWLNADPAGLFPLATALAEAGAVVVTISYRAADEGAFYPVPAQDVACGISYAMAAATEAAVRPTRVVAAGHSSGAQLAALTALRPDGLEAGCPYVHTSPNSLIGLAGPYDVVSARPVAINLFGPDLPDPDDWGDGNPLNHASERPSIDALLVHGLSDSDVPVWFTERFADALIDGGHVVEAAYLEDVDHFSIFSPQVAAPIIVRWLGLDS